ncbi:IclR family transcriptional regulator [Granulosicoccus antarcticus]|uniref:HTH-type transcriptional repressor AllR n=1 Tax=Granulosicoccus antarcticus IMCC3135 TaxID=1192854 RepID=A0A2Z2NRN1_9GAMM|nr:IclR family transcriptional regulator [Granulosicoccus antarcticus]ASJ73165.1 Transcriptional regulator KdgR [Granulosicoccus antarcticus IMCC3135]
MADEKNETKVDSTLSKGLAILETLAAATDGKGVTELSRELGYTKSNVFRLLQTLKHLGYVKNREDKSYTATLKTWQVGRHTIENLNLRDVASEEMRYLSRETGETIYLAVRENLSVVYISKIDSIKPIRSWNPIGGSAPVHCVGAGKAILASNYTTLRDAVKGSLTRHTDKTLTRITDLDADMALTLERGYSYDSGEFREGIISVGAAISLPDQETIASVSISLPEVNLGDITKEKLGALVVEAAAKVSAKLQRF